MYSVRGLYAMSRHFPLVPALTTPPAQLPARPKTTHSIRFMVRRTSFGAKWIISILPTASARVDFRISTLIRPSKLRKIGLQADLHQFSSSAQIRVPADEKLSANFGEELDIIATYNLTKTISFQAGYCTFLPTNSLAQVKGVKEPAENGQLGLSDDQYQT
jgi:hypothetical protein